MGQVPGGIQTLTDVALFAEVRVGLREPARVLRAPESSQSASCYHP